MKGIISAVRKNSLAELAGICGGEKLCSVNGRGLHDIIELSYLVADEKVELVIESKSGIARHVLIEKNTDEDLGLEFESAVFDEVTCCHNKCVFCFVDQMIPGMRDSLYVRDDDYRLSFLYGNFITLTNLKDADYDRIIKNHMSPLYISIHATDGIARQRMMKNKFSADILNNLQRLVDAGISVHTQIVLCPGYNDGDILKKTYSDLKNLAPMVETMAIVPVGITKNRENLPLMRLFTPEEASNIISEVEQWQIDCKKKMGKSFVYLGDEFYILANKPLPATIMYDGFPQIENGIGLTRNFLDEWEHTIVSNNVLTEGNAIIPVGKSAAKILEKLIENFNIKYGSRHLVLPVENIFFGDTINVTGLLTGNDILNELNKRLKEFQRVILPQKVLNSDNIFLDNMTFQEFCASYQGKVDVAADAKTLKLLLNK